MVSAAPAASAIAPFFFPPVLGFVPFFAPQLDFYVDTYQAPAASNEPFPDIVGFSLPWPVGFPFVPSFGGNDFVDGRGSAISFIVDLTNNFVFSIAGAYFLSAGYDNVAGTEANDVIRGDSGDNLLYGFGGDDAIIGTSGNDDISGGDGFDTVDYSLLNAPISVGQFGLITKVGNGQDTLQGLAGVFPPVATVERIVGSAAQINEINVTGAPSAIKVDLAAETLAIDGIAVPNNGDIFDIVNFDNVFGGDGDDTIAGEAGNNILHGNGGNDLILGTAGDDEISGGDGFDTVDYSSLNVAISVGQFGLITKAGSGQDTLQGVPGAFPPVATVERIVGSATQTNEINVIGAPNAITVDLAAETLAIDGIAVPNNGDVFDIVNFDNVFGGNGNDTLIGNGGNNVITGVAGQDSLTGGAGNDTFVLGMSAPEPRYYTDSSPFGFDEYAFITDFAAGDTIQLQGPATDYIFPFLGQFVVEDSGLLAGVLDAGDDLIAFVPARCCGWQLELCLDLNIVSARSLSRNPISRQ